MAIVTFQEKIAETLNVDLQSILDSNNSLNELAALRLEKIEVAGVFLQSKMAWKLAALVQAYIYRLVDLGEACCLAVNSKNYIPALIMGRAILETGAVVYDLNQELEKLIRDKNLSKIDDLIMRESFSTRLEDWLTENIGFFKARNILTPIGKLDKLMPGVLKTYHNLSEYAHPNRLGHAQAYESIDYETGDITFGQGRDPKAYMSSIFACFTLIELTTVTYPRFIKNWEEIAFLQC